VKATIKLDYVEFPVLAVVTVPVSKAARLNLFGGPTFSFNTKAEAEISLGSFSASADIGNAVKGFDVGLTFGAGMTFDVGSVILGFDGRYGFGLETIVDSDSANDFFSSGNADVKNKGFAFMGSVGIPVGSK
jgi:hypothetical protein